MESAYVQAYADIYRNHWWWRVREAILTDRIQRLVSTRSERPRILDVGCGAGLFFDVLERFGDVEGIESDAVAVANSGRWRRRIRLGELDEAYNPSQPFDLILMLDVLEHISAPETLLRRAAHVLRPGGRILITVPAFNWLWTAHDDLNHHVRRYSAGELRELIADTGLSPLEIRYIFQSLVVLKLLVRTKEALSPARPTVPGIPPPALNAALIRWYRAEYAMARWLPFGGSIMALAAHEGRPVP